MGKQRIFITGHPSGGTTLLLRCFYAFEGVKVMPTEVKPRAILFDREPQVIVGKNPGPPWLGRIHAHEWAKELTIVYIVRDGRDTMKHAKDVRWLDTMRDFEKFGHMAAIVLRYEDLCRDPDGKQAQLEKALGLKSKARFSDYPAFVPKKAFRNPTLDPKRYGPRPISCDGIVKNRKRYDSLDTQTKREFEGYLRRWGYEV